MIPILTIDGPSGVGKGTIARIVAQKYAWNLLDSGAIYRAFAFSVQTQNAAINDEKTLQKIAQNLDLKFIYAPDKTFGVYLQGVEVSAQLRTEVISELASKLAVIGVVRETLVKIQRNFIKPPGLVADGRDMGSVVFADAAYKVFLTATPEQRAKRRLKQLHSQGIKGIINEVLSQIEKRDERDSTRVKSPLKPTKDALIIDTTTLSIDKVVAEVIALIAG